MPGVAFRAPAVTTAPVANDTAGLWTFNPPVRGIIVRNTSGQIVYLKLNDTDAPSTTYGDYDYQIAGGTMKTLYAYQLGGITISTVGGWFPVGATVNSFHIRGIG
jgi:hypothetical protein